MPSCSLSDVIFSGILIFNSSAAKVVISSVDAGLSSDILKRDIIFSENCVSSKAIEISNNLKKGQIHFLENLRFYNEETKNDDKFSYKAFFKFFVKKFAVPSAVLSATFPVKPSVTITFDSPFVI